MITKEMTIGMILRTYPESIKIFTKYGLDCHECQIADLESVEHGAGVHKIGVDELLAELNRVCSPNG
ncbi:MAG: DUF1858 domain-containing protein [Geobacter sp.]|nr:DUF1858 domain-containing protein [Geobacter sp.]